MIIDLGAICAVINDGAGLTSEELRLVSPLAAEHVEKSFSLFLADDAAPFDPSVDGTRVGWDVDVAVLTHRFFSSRIDLRRRTVAFKRRSDEAWPLRIVLRAASTLFLTLDGWIPLHAAAVVRHGEAIVFPAPSGGGKSTLAASSPHQVLGDEMIAVNPASGLARPTVFWGDTVCRPAPCEDVPISALVGLRKGDRFAFAPVSGGEAARLITMSVLTPLGPPTASHVARAVSDASRRFRAGFMTWHIDAPPWDDLESVLGR